MNKQTANASADKANLSTQAPAPAAASATSSSAKGADSIADSVQSLVDQGVETLDTIKSRVSAATDGARTKGAQLVDRTAELVTENPLKGLAIAFGVGYIAMRITTSKLTSIAMIGGVLYAGSKLFRGQD